MLRPNRHSSQAAFSLVEMLIVIAVIGILAGIAILGMSSHIRHSREAIARQNAKQFASIARSVVAAGANPLADTVEATMTKIHQGITISQGVFANQTFSCRAIDQKGMERAAYYLDIQDGELVFLADKAINMAD
jgi:prepilin-type N-terminal cleavage/methylation domain-containing protein